MNHSAREHSRNPIIHQLENLIALAGKNKLKEPQDVQVEQMSH